MRSDLDSKLETKDAEVKELHALKESFDKEKEDCANQEKEKLSFALSERYAKDKMDLMVSLIHSNLSVSEKTDMRGCELDRMKTRGSRIK